MLKAINTGDKFFRKNGIAIIRIGQVIDNETVEDLYVRVYGFPKISDYDKETIEINGTYYPTNLRINTLYGIGFIGLVPEGHKNATDYKINIGTDNKPVIMAFEKVPKKEKV